MDDEKERLLLIVRIVAIISVLGLVLFVFKSLPSFLAVIVLVPLLLMILLVVLKGVFSGALFSFNSLNRYHMQCSDCSYQWYSHMGYNPPAMCPDCHSHRVNVVD